MTDCKDKCWCKNFPVKYSEWYEALKPLESRIEKIESIVLLNIKNAEDYFQKKRKPHLCPVCEGRKTVEICDAVRDCEPCDATGVIWG